MCPSVIALVLDTTSHEFLTFDNNLLAVQVGASQRAYQARSVGYHRSGTDRRLRRRPVLIFAQGDDAGLST